MILFTGASGYLCSNLLNYIYELDSKFLEQCFLLDRSLKTERFDFQTIHSKEASLASFKIAQEAKLKDLKSCFHSCLSNKLEEEIAFLKQIPKNCYLVFFSTAAVYGNCPESGAKSSDSPQPINDYGKYKLEIEKYIQKNFPQHLILRIANPYGKEPHGKGVYQIFKNKILKALQLQEICQLQVNSDKAQEAFRDFIYIDDFCKIVFNLYQQKKQGIANISSGNASSLEDFAKSIFDELKAHNKTNKTFTQCVHFTYSGKRSNEIIFSKLIPELAAPAAF